MMEGIKFALYAFPDWESVKLTKLLEECGHPPSLTINSSQQSELEELIGSPLTILYEEHADVFSLQKQMEAWSGYKPSLVFWVCVSSNYAQNFVGKLTYSLDHSLLLRPLEKSDIEALVANLREVSGVRKLKIEFLAKVQSFLDLGATEEAIKACQAVSQDAQLKIIASMKLSEIYWDTHQDFEKLAQMKLMLTENKFNFFILDEMVVYLRMFSDKVPELEALVQDVITLYPCESRHLADLYRVTLLLEKYNSIIPYKQIADRFPDSSEIRKIKTAALFVVIKYYIALNDIDKVKEAFDLFKIVNTKLTNTDELIYYAEGLGNREKMIRLFHEGGDKPA